MKGFPLQCFYIPNSHRFIQNAGAGIPLLLVALVFMLYAAGVLSLIGRNKRWHGFRTASFCAGCVLLAAGLSPPISDYAYHDFRGHMLQHLLLGMIVPVGLMLGAPVTLALKALPRKTAGAVSRILRKDAFHFISHPAIALLLNTGGMFVLYLTPLYNILHHKPFLHHLVHFHFLAAGSLFAWAIAGPDPAPRRPRFSTRLAILFASIAAHAYLSKSMYAYIFPKNSIHSREEIQAAAKLMYYGGDFAELLLVIALFAIWYNRKGKRTNTSTYPSLADSFSRKARNLSRRER